VPLRGSSRGLRQSGRMMTATVDTA